MKLARLLAPAAIVLLGASLRLYQLDLTKFPEDQVAALNLASAWIDQGQLPLIGLESFTVGGVNRPAGMSYLMTPVLLLSRDPLVATLYVALLSILSLPVLYRLVRLHFGGQAALLATLLYASSFWAAYVARHAWDIAPLAPLAVLVLDRLLAAVCGRRPGALGWALCWAAVAVAIHPAAIGLVAAVLVTALLLRPPVRLAATLPGLALATLVWTPFLWYLWTTRGQDLGQALRLGGKPWHIDLDIVANALWQLFPNPRDPLLQVPGGAVVPAAGMLELLHPVITAGFLGALAWCGIRALDRRASARETPAYRVLLLAYLTPQAVLIPHPFPIYDRYTFLLLPYAAIIAALGLLAAGRWLATQTGKARQGPAGAAATGFRAALGCGLGVAVVQAAMLIAFLDWVAANGSTFASGVPLRFTLQAIDAAAKARASPEDPISVATRPDNEAVYGYLLRGIPANLVDQDRALVFPGSHAQPAVYLTIADESAAARLLRERFPQAERFRLFRTYAIMKGFSGVAIGTSFPPEEQVSRLRSSPPDYYRVFLLPPNAGVVAQAAAAQARGPWMLSNGLVLEGFSLADDARSGDDLVLTLAWSVPMGISGAGSSPRFFAHLLDGKGRKWGEANELSHGPEYWRAGDRIISWLRIPVEPDALQGLYSLYFGMFDADSQERFTVTWSGQTADSLVTGPFRVKPRLPPATPQHPLDPPARFGDSLDLLGYDLPGDVQAGAEVNLRLVWRAVRPVRIDYSLFVHLLDGSGSLVAQDDGFPSDGLYPTSAWRAGELVEDRRRLPVPQGAQGQQFSVAVGWYRFDTGERLALGSPFAAERSLLLGPVVARP